MSEKKAITRIQVEGYRSIKSIDLAPGRITVLIGANGAGKSNLLSLLKMVALMRTRSLRRFVGEAGGASALLHYGPKTTREISVRLEFEQDTGAAANAYGARLGYAAGDAFVYLDETLEYRPRGSKDFKSVSLGAGHNESRLDDEAQQANAGMAKAVRWFLTRLNFYHFHDTSSASPLRQNAQQSDDQYLRSDGSNLAAFLRRLAGSEDEDEKAAWRRICALVQQIAPYVKQLEPDLVNPANPERSAVRLYWVDERDHRFDVHDFSDGTLRAIALFAALGQPASRLPALVSIDEPELGLHPAAVALFAELVRSVAPRCQVLLATQAPALLDLFEPEEVVVAERHEGATSLHRRDPAELASWLEDYSLSQLFDKNILGGRP